MTDYLTIAIEAARAGGSVLREHYGKITQVREKGRSGDLVTEADLASESAVLALLRDGLPEATIISEESAPSIEQLELAWVVDPLDGTTNYAHGVPLVGVSIALLIEGVPEVGVVYNPLTDELFEAEKGKGARLNGDRIHVSKVAAMSDALLATGFAYNRAESYDPNYLEFCYLTNMTHGVRRLGAAAVDLAYVACGRFDGYWEHGLNIWDIAAGILLVEEAGGNVSDYTLAPIDLVRGQILASNGVLHETLHSELIKAREWRDRHPVQLPIN